MLTCDGDADGVRVLSAEHVRGRREGVAGSQA